MPTPFTHLHIANALDADPMLPDSLKTLVDAHYGAYLLGSICADATSTGIADRETTHFYRYDRPITEPPWRVMLASHPALCEPKSPAHEAFIAGYVAHLAADEYWSRYMLKPHFVDRDWGGGIRERFFALNLLITYMDERDLATLTSGDAQKLLTCFPADWLPFLPDKVLVEWRDFMAEQITGASQTLEILGKRIMIAPDKLRAMLDDTSTMQNLVWDHITPPILHEVETAMYAYSREQMMLFYNEVTL